MKAQPDQITDTGLSGSAPRPRLAIVVSHPIQHFCPMYRDLVRDGRVELLVIFAIAGAVARFDTDFNRVVKWQDNITEGFPHVVVGSEEPARSKGVVAELVRFAPDVVYSHGYHEPYHKATIRWCKANQVPVMMTSDSELRNPRPLHVRIAKKFILPRIFRQIDLFLTVGDANEEYFENFGVSRSKFFRVPFSIDSSQFQAVLDRRAEVRSAVRRKLGIPEDQLIVLNVGKLILLKGQGYMIRAFERSLQQAKVPVTLVIAGDGNNRPALEEQVKPLAESVKLLGFIGVEELPDYYVAADIYVHPSSFDPHPLAVSEAAFCSLPLLASDRIGSTGPTDDLQVDRNGWVFPYGDEQTLTAQLTRLINDPALRRQAGEASRPLGLAHSSDRIARLYVEATMGLVASKSRQA